MELPVEFLEESLETIKELQLQGGIPGPISEWITEGTFGELLQRYLEISR